MSAASLLPTVHPQVPDPAVLKGAADRTMLWLYIVGMWLDTAWGIMAQAPLLTPSLGDRAHIHSTSVGIGTRKRTCSSRQN